MGLYETFDRTLDIWGVEEFDLKQHKQQFDDWVRVYEKSVRKRVAEADGHIGVGLSSGYDSGAIVCELLAQDVPFTAISIVSDKEDRGILDERHEIIRESGRKVIAYDWNDKEYEETGEYIKNKIPPFIFTIWNNKDYIEYLPMYEDSGANKTVRLCELASEHGVDSLMIGQGSDEIFADYGHNGRKNFGHSNFGGRFPENLRDVIPWTNFSGSTQRAYLMYCELIGEAFGIQGLYPYLDHDVVQEFLWLDSKLKNVHYKAPLHYYLVKSGFPFRPGRKSGF